MRADVLPDEGDVDGAVTWRRNLEVIEELQRGRREDERTNQLTACNDRVVRRVSNPGPPD
jgi:hypothetical protein